MRCDPFPPGPTILWIQRSIARVCESCASGAAPHKGRNTYGGRHALFPPFSEASLRQARADISVDLGKFKPTDLTFCSRARLAAAWGKIVP